MTAVQVTPTLAKRSSEAGGASLDVEQLVTWAYRDELSKRVTSSAEQLWTKLEQYQQLGMIPEMVPGAPQRYDLGVPDPDAELIEQEIAQLPDLELDWQTASVCLLGDMAALLDLKAMPPPSAAQVRQRSTFASWRGIQGSRQRVALDPPRRVLMVRPLRTAALVVMHAHLGNRPSWVTKPSRPAHVPATRGSGPQVVGHCRGRNLYATGSYCPLRWEPSPIYVAEQRADYLAWWRGLELLAQRLAGKLRRHVALPPSAPQMPWLR